MHHRQQAQFLELQQQAAALQLWKDENAGDQYNSVGGGHSSGNAALGSKANAGAVPPLNMRKVAASVSASAATVSSSSRGAAGHQLAFDAGAALVSARGAGAGVPKGNSSARVPVSLR